MRFSSFITQYKKARQTESSPAWRAETRRALLAEIRQSPAWQHAPAKRFAQPRIFDVLSFSSAMELFKPIAIGTLLLAVVATSSLATVQAAQASLPGDALYSVKLGIEHAQVMLASSENKKAELEVGFAATRLEEVGEIVSAERTDQTAKNVSAAMERFTEDLSSVQERLEKLRNNEKTTHQALEVSKLVNESTQAIEESLRDIKDRIEQKDSAAISAAASSAASTTSSDNASSTVSAFLLANGQASSITSATSSVATASGTPAVSETAEDSAKAHAQTSSALLETLDTAIHTVDQVNIKSLEVFIDKAQSSESKVLKSEAVDKLQKKIQKIEKEIIATEQKIEAVAQQAKDAKTDSAAQFTQSASTTPPSLPKKDQVASTTTPATAPQKSETAPATPSQKTAQEEMNAINVSIDKTISDVQEKPSQAKESIEQAKKIISEQGGEDLSGILQKVKDAKEIVTEADKTIKQVVDTIVAPSLQTNSDEKGKILGEQATSSTTPAKIDVGKTTQTASTPARGGQ